MSKKIVFITGASSGIGEACAVKCAENGMNLILCARRFDKVDALAKQLAEKYKIEVYPFKLDVSDRDAVEVAIGELPEQWRDIDVLINNAGFALALDMLHDGDPDDWDQMIDVNVKGLLYVTKAILPAMVKRGCGHVINLGSIAGHNVYQGAAVYCASKHAVRALTENLRMDIHASGVRVTEIAPGMVETEFSQVRFKGDKEKAASVYKDTRPLSAEDIANSILFCMQQPEHVNISTMTIYPTDQSSPGMVRRDD